MTTAIDRPSVSAGTLFRVVHRDRDHIGDFLCNYLTLLEARAAQLTDPVFRLRRLGDRSWIETAGMIIPGTSLTCKID